MWPCPAHVGAIEFQEVEAVEERPRLVPASAQQVEGGEPALITAHHLPVDQTGPHLSGFSLARIFQHALPDLAPAKKAPPKRGLVDINEDVTRVSLRDLLPLSVCYPTLGGSPG